MTGGTLATGTSPTLGDVAGQSVVLHYGDVAAEYGALRNGAMLVDRSVRGRTRIEGAKAAELITGLVTNDVQSLSSGQGQYAAALSPKGRIIADVRIFAEQDRLLVDTPPRARAGWMDMLRKYINPRVVPYRDESATLRAIGVFGPAARQLAAAVCGTSPDTLALLPPYGHRAGEIDSVAVIVAHVPDIEIEGYELFLPAEAFTDIWRRFSAAGATPGGLMAWEVARIEAGRPEWGLDIDDTTIPQEANFDELHAISYTKGCYVGQEVVARIHFRGHVNRHLRGLLCGHDAPPPRKAALFDDSGKQVGDVRSSAWSPRLGAVALAMVRREIEPSATLTMRWDGGEGRADVTMLPFPR